MIEFLSGKRWGADPSTLVTLYKSYFRSVIDYVRYVYFPTCKTQLKKLEIIQNDEIIGALRFCMPKNVLLAEAKLPLSNETGTVKQKFLVEKQPIQACRQLAQPKAFTTFVINIKKTLQKSLL